MGWPLSCWWTHPSLGSSWSRTLGSHWPEWTTCTWKCLFKILLLEKKVQSKFSSFLQTLWFLPSPHFLLVDYRNFCRSMKMSLWSHKIKAFWSYIRISRVFAPSYLPVWASVSSGFMSALALKDFDFQKEDEEDGFEGVKCGESGFCSGLAPRNNVITKSCIEWYLIWKMRSIFIPFLSSFFLEKNRGLIYTEQGSRTSDGNYPDQHKDAVLKILSRNPSIQGALWFPRRCSFLFSLFVPE